jgi:hypothetical protein
MTSSSFGANLEWSTFKYKHELRDKMSYWREALVAFEILNTIIAEGMECDFSESGRGDAKTMRLLGAKTTCFCFAPEPAQMHPTGVVVGKWVESILR